jgi:hypothetical protein
MNLDLTLDFVTLDFDLTLDFGLRISCVEMFGCNYSQAIELVWKSILKTTLQIGMRKLIIFKVFEEL